MWEPPAPTCSSSLPPTRLRAPRLHTDIPLAFLTPCHAPPATTSCLALPPAACRQATEVPHAAAGSSRAGSCRHGAPAAVCGCHSGCGSYHCGSSSEHGAGAARRGRGGGGGGVSSCVMQRRGKGAVQAVTFPGPEGDTERLSAERAVSVGERMLTCRELHSDCTHTPGCTLACADTQLALLLNAHNFASEPIRFVAVRILQASYSTFPCFSFGQLTSLSGVGLRGSISTMWCGVALPLHDFPFSDCSDLHLMLCAVFLPACCYVLCRAR